MNAAPRTNRSKFDAALWAGQWLLAGFFQTSGVLKLLVDREELSQLPGALAFSAPAATLHRVGAIELVAALAVVLPAATRIAPQLSVAAAAAIFGSALLGAVSPVTAGGFLSAPLDAALAAVALAVAYGRVFEAPIAPLATEVDDAIAADEAAAHVAAAQLARARARHQPGIASCVGAATRPLSSKSTLPAAQAAPPDTSSGVTVVLAPQDPPGTAGPRQLQQAGS